MNIIDKINERSKSILLKQGFIQNQERIFDNYVRQYACDSCDVENLLQENQVRAVVVFIIHYLLLRN